MIREKRTRRVRGLESKEDGVQGEWKRKQMQHTMKITELGNELFIPYPISLTFRYNTKFQVQVIRRIMVKLTELGTREE